MLLSLFYPVLYCATFSYLDLYIVWFHFVKPLNPSINDESISKLSYVTIHQRVIVAMLCILFLFLAASSCKRQVKKEWSTKKLRNWPYGQNDFLKVELKKYYIWKKIRWLNKQIFDQKILSVYATKCSKSCCSLLVHVKFWTLCFIWEPKRTQVIAICDVP